MSDTVRRHVTHPQHDGVAPNLLRTRPQTAAAQALHRAMVRRAAVPVDDASCTVTYRLGAGWDCYMWTRTQGLVPMGRATSLLSRS